MKEPINPIKILKDNQELEPHLFERIKPPFVIFSRDISLEIEEGDIPIYFKRKKCKGRLNLFTGNTELELESIKYRIGKITKAGIEVSYWISSEGKEIIEEE